MCSEIRNECHGYTSGFRAQVLSMGVQSRAATQAAIVRLVWHSLSHALLPCFLWGQFTHSPHAPQSIVIFAKIDRYLRQFDDKIAGLRCKSS